MKTTSLTFFSLAGASLANQLVRFDDPKFLLRGVFDDNDLDADIIFDQFMSGEWCSTLDNFSFPRKSNWAAMNANPVEKLCKMWRICRMETKRKEHTCNQLVYKNKQTQAVNGQPFGSGQRFFANQQTLSYSAQLYSTLSGEEQQWSRNMAGYTCKTDINETPCLRKTCICDLTLADKTLDHVVAFYQQELKAGRGEQHGLLVEEDQQPLSEADFLNELKDTVIDQAEIDQMALDEQIVEIVQDHSKLVEEHSQLVQDINNFKEKVQNVVEEHTKLEPVSLESMEQLDKSLEAENNFFEEASDTAEDAVIEMMGQDLVVAEEIEEEEAEVAESENLEDLEQSLDAELDSMQEFFDAAEELKEESAKPAEEDSDIPMIDISGSDFNLEIPEIPESMMAEIAARREREELEQEGEKENEPAVFEDIAMFNQDFVFDDESLIKK